MTTCKNCKYLMDPFLSSVCGNSDSEHCCEFMLPNDSCNEFEHASILATGEYWSNV